MSQNGHLVDETPSVLWYQSEKRSLNTIFIYFIYSLCNKHEIEAITKCIMTESIVKLDMPHATCTSRAEAFFICNLRNLLTLSKPTDDSHSKTAGNDR